MAVVFVKNFILSFLTFLLAVLLLMNFLMVISGLLTAAGDFGCHTEKPLRRIEYVVLGFRAGCWLGQRGDGTY